MAYEVHLDEHAFSGVTAATTITPHHPVFVGGTTIPYVVPCASNNIAIDGVTGAGTTASGAQAVVYFDGNVVKIKAAASLGAGADVTVGSTVTGSVWGGSVFAASAHWVVGRSLSTAAAGEFVSVFVKTRKFA